MGKDFQKILLLGAKVLMGLLALVLTVIGAKWLYKKFLQKDQTNEVNEVKEDTKAFTKVGIKPTYAQTWYSDQASQFFEKFKDYDYITKAKREDILPYLKRLNNYLDYLLFKKAFGIRKELTASYTLSEFVVEYFDELGEATYNGYIRGLLEHAKSKGIKFS